MVKVLIIAPSRSGILVATPAGMVLAHYAVALRGGCFN
jgi:hypothetical protein